MDMKWWNQFKAWLARAWDRTLGNNVTVNRSGTLCEADLALPRRVPAVDVYENSNELLFQVDVPGAVPTSTSVTLHEGVLTIQAHVEDQFLWLRAFTLPDQVEPDGVQARLRDGVLSLHLTKRTDAVRLIPVRTAEA